MDENMKVGIFKNQVRAALTAYCRHSEECNGIDLWSEKFVDKFSRRSMDAKTRLRELFRKSSGWNEVLDAIVIDASRTHEPDQAKVYSLGFEIMSLNGYYGSLVNDARNDIDRVLKFFTQYATLTEEERGECIAVIERIAPNAYKPGKKLSRVFKAVCKELGMADESAGSEFQKLFAKFADELNSKRIDFKLYLSLNPAHILTMSNPAGDDRGETLVSCHSLNEERYGYNNGCTGYALDDVTFIVFTVAHDDNPEDFYTRKTTRQIFAYEDGTLLQSRLYNTSGGTDGQQEISKVYRDLVQREIATLEDDTNLWQTFKSYESDLVSADSDFGGYKDWKYRSYEGRICVLKSRLDNPARLIIGEAGMCLCCADSITESSVCESCREAGEKTEVCECCNCTTNAVYRVRHRENPGEFINICYDCRDYYFRQCPDCGEYFYGEDAVEAADHSLVCPACVEDHYVKCHHCQKLFHKHKAYETMTRDYEPVFVCETCRVAKGYIECDQCYLQVQPDKYGDCPYCGSHVANAESV